LLRQEKDGYYSDGSAKSLDIFRMMKGPENQAPEEKGKLEVIEEEDRKSQENDL
jgi:hypothetical protein